METRIADGAREGASSHEDLTPEQREAVEHEEGPLLVLAGAGSGKTRVITHRIARLIEKGVPAGSILSITFTNKAAAEMAERVATLVGSERPRVSTFHAFCARLLREDIPRLGYRRDFAIYDEDDAEAVAKEALAAVGAKELLKPAAARAAISRWKSRLVGPDEAYSSVAGSHRERALAEAYGVYERLLRERCSLDFDDLLLKTLEVLRVHREVADKWRSRLAYLQVDEYQDTNRVQYEILRSLAAASGNLAVVGDPDQSIYSWRGAEPSNIRDFLRDFPSARVVRLSRNYRSSQSILDAACALISHNPGERAGPLSGVRGCGRPARVLVTWDEEHEALAIAERIDRAIVAGRRPREIAVFYRTNAQSRTFEQVFLRRGVPYSVVGAVAFYQRREVKDALAYLRVALNRSDDVAFRRIANVPPRGLGAGGLEKLAEAASARGLSLADAAREPAVLEALGERARAGIEQLDSLLGRLAALAEGPAAEAVRAAIEETGLRRMYEGSGDSDRVENLEELLAAATGFDKLRPGSGLRGFLEDAALQTDLDLWDDKAERVALMTLHAAKGLEFPVVFVAGLEEGLLPHARSLGESVEALEEERRLLYVAMTRAMDELWLSCARSRRQGGQTRLCVRSRFLDEIPRELVAVEDLTSAPERSRADSRAAGRPRSLAGDREPTYEPVAAGRRARARTVADPDAPDDIDWELEPGDRVVHPSFGSGRVVEVKGSGARARVTVDFLEVGRKVLALGFASLKKA